MEIAAEIPARESKPLILGGAQLVQAFNPCLSVSIRG
jgi:hypothetical protein